MVLIMMGVPGNEIVDALRQLSQLSVMIFGGHINYSGDTTLNSPSLSSRLR